MAASIPRKAEKAWIDLFERVLDETAIPQARFDWLRGDPTPKRKNGTTLPVDAYFPVHRVVLEYRGKQHYTANRFMDARPGRAVQRHRYDQRRESEIPAHDLRLVVVRYDESPSEAFALQKLRESGMKVGPLGQDPAGMRPERSGPSERERPSRGRIVLTEGVDLDPDWLKRRPPSRHEGY